jgi:hypothetical protein
MKTKNPSDAAPKEQFIKIPRGLMVSDAWLSMKASHLKIVSAICEEHMRKGGKENGNLKATHRQLSALGIWPGDVARLIRDLEEWGLIECQRGGMRTPIRYALTWLPRADGRRPSNLWQAYRAAENQKSARENEGSAARENEGRGSNLHGKTKADWPKNLHGKTKALSRYPLPGKEVGVGAGSAASAVSAGEGVVPFPGSAQGGRFA